MPLIVHVTNGALLPLMHAPDSKCCQGNFAITNVLVRTCEWRLAITFVTDGIRDKWRYAAANVPDCACDVTSQ